MKLGEVRDSPHEIAAGKSQEDAGSDESVKQAGGEGRAINQRIFQSRSLRLLGSLGGNKPANDPCEDDSDEDDDYWDGGRHLFGYVKRGGKSRSVRLEAPPSTSVPDTLFMSTTTTSDTPAPAERITKVKTRPIQPRNAR